MCLGEIPSWFREAVDGIFKRKSLARESGVQMMAIKVVYTGPTTCSSLSPDCQGKVINWCPTHDTMLSLVGWNVPFLL